MIAVRRLYARANRRLHGGPRAQHLLLAFFLASLTALLVFVLGWNLPLASRIQVKPGQVAPFDIVSPRQITYISDLLTEQARARAANAVPDQYESAAGSVRREQVMGAREIMAQISAVRVDEGLSEDDKLYALMAIEGLGLSAEASMAILELSDEEWAQTAAETPLALDRILRNEIRPDLLPAAQRNVPATVRADMDEAAFAVTVDLVQALVRPNSFFNEERTQQMRDDAAAAVAPQAVSVEQGQTVLRAGDVATPEDIEALEQIGLLNQQWDWWTFLRALAFSSVLMAVTVGALYRLRTRTAHRLREAAILSLLAAAWLIAAKFMIVPHDWLPYLYPVAALSMLAACLVHVRTAVVLTVSLSLVVHYLGGSNPVLVVYSVVGGLAGALILGRAERITAFLWAALAVVGANLFAILAYRIPFEAMSNQQVLQLLFVVALNGGLSASIALLGYFGLGNLFGLTTSLQLNELSRPTHPLLRQLLLKASGTYHHTIVVSNLAERGAAAVGADALLARVGAYYHDIGKTVRPYFFTENIDQDASPHDKLDPLTSAQIIISHVRDGLDLAQKYRLPRRIQDFIREHHGRSVVQYFYVRAQRAANEGETVDIEDFRYPGPRPRSKETAILALADTCEAAVRAMKPATREELATLVNRLIDERVDEGELNESNLTFQDLQSIREIFIQVLQGVHHPRISYPESARAQASVARPAPAAEPAPSISASAAALEGQVAVPGEDAVAASSIGAAQGAVDARRDGLPAAAVQNGAAKAGVEEIDEPPEMVSLDKAG